MPGTDGQKMSKSYGNTIEIFAEGKPLKKTVMGIVTDSDAGRRPPKDPETCNVFALYSLFATEGGEGGAGGGATAPAAWATARPRGAAGEDQRLLRARPRRRKELAAHPEEVEAGPPGVARAERGRRRGPSGWNSPWGCAPARRDEGTAGLLPMLAKLVLFGQHLAEPLAGGRRSGVWRGRGRSRS